MSDLYILNHNIDTCTGGDQEAITIKAQRVGAIDGLDTAEEVSLNEKVNHIFMNVRNSIILGHEDFFFGASIFPL